MKNIIYFQVVFLFSLFSYAGNGVKGGEPMKDRFLLALNLTVRILKSSACKEYFTLSECQQMTLKLTTVDPNLCKGEKLCWYNTDSDNLLPPLKPVLNGKPIETILSTTSELSSPVNIDVIRAKQMNVSFMEAIVVLTHEAGHVIGLSDDLTTDHRIIELFNKKTPGISNITEDPDCLTIEQASELADNDTQNYAYPVCPALEDTVQKIATFVISKHDGSWRWFQSSIQFVETFFYEAISMTAYDDGASCHVNVVRFRPITEVSKQIAVRSLGEQCPPGMFTRFQGNIWRNDKEVTSAQFCRSYN